jgi:opacity protein-like surface antigen
MAGGMGTGVDNLSVELDLTSSVAVRTADTRTLETLSVMLNGVLTLPVSDQFSLYGGAGAGLMRVDIRNVNPTASGSGLGGQVFAGASFQVTDNVAVFGEGRMQATLGDVSLFDGGDTYPVNFARTSLLAGIKIGM